MATSRAKNKKNMNMLYKDTKSGFTIIEVVLVLAIAGLIFLMVFIALPQLQRAQRDTQRNSDLSRLAAAITDYQSNNNGRLPSGNCEPTDDTIATLDGMVSGSTTCKMIRNYLLGVDAKQNTFTDPLTGAYKVKLATPATGGTSYAPTSSSADDVYGVISMYVGGMCDNENDKVMPTNNSRDYVFVYKRESGGWSCRAGSR